MIAEIAEALQDQLDYALESDESLFYEATIKKISSSYGGLTVGELTAITCRVTLKDKRTFLLTVEVDPVSQK